jgi:hypothetical protein
MIKNPIVILLVILIGAPLAGAYFAWQVGELTSWTQFTQIILHGSLASVMLAIGWLFFKSPWSGSITELLNIRMNQKTGEKEVTKLTVDGATVIPEIPSLENTEGKKE